MRQKSYQLARHNHLQPTKCTHMILLFSVGLDLIKSLVRNFTNDKIKYLLAFVCVFSSYVEVQGMASKTAQNILNSLKK